MLQINMSGVLVFHTIIYYNEDEGLITHCAHIKYTFCDYGENIAKYCLPIIACNLNIKQEYLLQFVSLNIDC